MNADERPSKSLQLWPGGRCITYRGDPHGACHQLEIKETYKRDDPWHEATPEERKAIIIEELAEMYAQRDILCCDSSLVSDMIGFEHEEWNWDNVSNLRPDPSEWTLEQCKEGLEDKGHDLPDPNPWAMDRAALLEFIEADSEDDGVKDERNDAALLEAAIQCLDDESVDGLNDWREAVRDNAEEEEIYEWWRVDKWLAEGLKGIGECVLDNAYGTWWGRTCTGQQLIMDGTLQQIAAKYANI